MMRAQAAKQAQAKPEPKAKKPRWKVVVDNTADQDTQSADHLALDKLRAGMDYDLAPLPHRGTLESAFGQNLGFARVAQGPLVEAALAHEGALAANRDDVLFLPEAAPLGLVAHEVAHLLQRHGFAPVDPDAAEQEARSAEIRAESGLQIPETGAQPAPGETAFRRPDDLSDAQISTDDVAQARAEFDAATARAVSGPDQQNTPRDDQQNPPQTPDTAPASDAAIPAPDLGPDQAENPVPTFELPPDPEIVVDEAAADAARRAADAAYAAADDADSLMQALKDAPPSVKARQQGALEEDTARLAAEEQAGFDGDMPEFEARMSGEDDLPDTAPVTPPGGEQAALEDAPPAPTPDVAVDPTPDPGAAELNEAIDRLLAMFFGGGGAAELGRAFDDVRTSDEEVDTSAGERPTVPLEGETDPARVTDQEDAARRDVGAKRQEAMQSVLDGPGPEQVQLQEMSETFLAEPREAAEVTSELAEPSSGAEAFLEMELDSDVTALFDEHHAEPLSTSLQGAQDEANRAVSERDIGRDAEIAKAEEKRDQLNADADESQRDEVRTQRQTIQDARQTAVDDQARHVADMETEAESKRQIAEGEISSETDTTDRRVREDFDEAESKADAKVAEGDRKAEGERKKAERDSRNRSWWERAASWVADQFEKLTSLINDIFDAVRSAVKDIIDKVKDAALALIDAAASAIKSAIERFGEALKSAVNAVLAEHFPAVAQAVNDAIDSGVELAKSAVDVVADKLKAGITAMLDALAAGLDAVLGVFQGVINGALALARAVITGDWSAVVEMVLEPILRALGINPADFYETMSRLGEAMGVIVDEPMTFLGNLVESVKGGILKFSDNFLTHLQTGLIEWLAGPLGSSITMPERWDLWGLLDLGRQILGLTLDTMRRIAVRVLGEEAVERIEFFVSYVADLISGGWSALWERIQQDLGRLADSVMEQISSFISLEVIKAAGIWLASLFTPVGALIKLVKTIWNFLVFLKNQLVRIIQVATTVINTLWEIATGVLEPAMQGVENTLARMVSIVIALFARLMDVGNIPADVQRIIGGIRQSIEDAIVSLIERVMAWFTGRGRGGADGAESDAEDSDTDLMQTIPFAGAGESHSLYVQENGEDTVPMMRSTPTPVATWLHGLRGEGLVAIGSRDGRNWTPEQITEKREQIEPLITTSLSLVAELDQLGDTANAREDAAPEGQEPEPSPELAAKGAELAGALTRILESLGLTLSGALSEEYADQIAALNDDVRTQLVNHVLRNLDPADFLGLSWDAFVSQLANSGGLTGNLREPLKSTGIVRRTDSGMRESYLAKVVSIVEAKFPGVLQGGRDADTRDNFLSHYLGREVNTTSVSRRVLVVLMQGNATGAQVADEIQREIETAATRRFGETLAYDSVFRDVNADFYRRTVLNSTEILTGTAIFGPYFEDEAENAAGAGPGGRGQPFSFFVKPLSDGGTPRFTANRGKLAQAIRDARPGNHEWILASKAASILASTADRVALAGNLDPVVGAAKILRFQDTVRTPTNELLFDPDASFLSNYNREIPYLSQAHVDIGKPYDEMTPDEQTLAYPRPGLGFGETVRALHGHAGGFFAGELADGELVRGGNLQWSSTDWHTKLADRLKQPIDDNLASGSDGRDIRNAIVGFYRDTIWDGADDLPGGVKFNLYFLSGESRSRDYAALKARAAAAFQATVPQLESDIDEALS